MIAKFKKGAVWVILGIYSLTAILLVMLPCGLAYLLLLGMNNLFYQGGKMCSFLMNKAYDGMETMSRGRRRFARFNMRLFRYLDGRK